MRDGEATRTPMGTALRLNDEIRILAGNGLALGISPGAFDLPGIEAVACPLQQMALRAAVESVRVKPGSVTNPRDQRCMWLPRLGLAGDAFA